MPDSLDIFSVSVSSKTTWIFFKLSGESGKTGLGEATVHGQEKQLLKALPAAIQACNQCPLGLSAKQEAIRAVTPAPCDHAIASALEQSWLDRLGKTAGHPLHTLLGGSRRKSIPTYANINRGTLTREPQEFAQRAQAAVDSGYSAIKLAPFDGLTPEHCTPAQSADERNVLFQHALDRVAAVAAQIGKRAEIRVDCHSRLRDNEVLATIDQLAELGVSWLEEPMLENTDRFKRIAAFREYANTKDMLLVGGENVPNLLTINNMLSAGCYDVVMPDVVLAGGAMEVMRMGHVASMMNCNISLHNPCGPVMDAVSANVAAALPGFHSLERQYDESPLYDEVIKRKHTHRDGHYHLLDVSGVGCTLVESHPMVVHQASFTIIL